MQPSVDTRFVSCASKRLRTAGRDSLPLFRSTPSTEVGALPVTSFTCSGDAHFKHLQATHVDHCFLTCFVLSNTIQTLSLSFCPTLPCVDLPLLLSSPRPPLQRFHRYPTSPVSLDTSVWRSLGSSPSVHDVSRVAASHWSTDVTRQQEGTSRSSSSPMASSPPWHWCSPIAARRHTCVLEQSAHRPCVKLQRSRAKKTTPRIPGKFEKEVWQQLSWKDHVFHTGSSSNYESKFRE